MKMEDAFLKKAKAGLASAGVSEYSEARLIKVIAIADSVIPLLEPSSYDIDVESNGQIVISFTTDDLIVQTKNAASFLELIREAALVRFFHCAHGEMLGVKLYFGL